jgi:hypothetical protein
MKKDDKEGCVWAVVGGCLAFYAFWWGLVKVAALAWR